MDKDGKNELIIAYYDVFVYSSNYTLLGRTTDTSGRCYTGHVVADIDGDGTMGILLLLFLIRLLLLFDSLNDFKFLQILFLILPQRLFWPSPTRSSFSASTRPAVRILHPPRPSLLPFSFPIFSWSSIHLSSYSCVVGRAVHSLYRDPRSQVEHLNCSQHQRASGSRCRRPRWRRQDRDRRYLHQLQHSGTLCLLYCSKNLISDEFLPHPPAFISPFFVTPIFPSPVFRIPSSSIPTHLPIHNLFDEFLINRSPGLRLRLHWQALSTCCWPEPGLAALQHPQRDGERC